MSKDDESMNRLQLQYLYTVEDYSTFEISVQSGDFSGKSHVCLSGASIHQAIYALSTMDANLKGTCKLQDCDSDDYLQFSFLKLGQLQITGQLGGSINPQYLVFQMQADQTLLREILLAFRSVSPTK